MQYFGEGRWAKRTFLQQSTNPNISAIWISCHFAKGEYPPRGEATGKRSLSYILTEGRWESWLNLTNLLTCKLGLKIRLILRRAWCARVVTWCDAAWPLHGLCMASAWPLHGLCMASACFPFLPFPSSHHLRATSSWKKHCGELLSHYLARMRLNFAWISLYIAFLILFS